MKGFYILAVAFLYKVSTYPINFKYPSPLTTKVFSPEPGKISFEITWSPVKNWDQNDPIIGYKLAFWEMKKPKKMVNGELVDDENCLSPKTPVGPPTIYQVPADMRKILINDIKAEVPYEFAALAFTKKGEGPLSSIVGLKVLKNREKHEVPEIQTEPPYYAYDTFYDFY